MTVTVTESHYCVADRVLTGPAAHRTPRPEFPWCGVTRELARDLAGAPTARLAARYLQSACLDCGAYLTGRHRELALSALDAGEWDVRSVWVALTAVIWALDSRGLDAGDLYRAAVRAAVSADTGIPVAELAEAE